MTPTDQVRLDGRRSTGVWGAAAGAGVLAIVLAYFLYAYLYLSVSADRWPPGQVPDPPLLRSGVLLAVLVLSAGAAVRAGRTRPPGDGDIARSVVVPLVTVAAAGTVVLVLGVLLVADLELEPRAQSYAAIFTTVHAVQGAATLAGIAISGFTAYEAHRLGPHPWVAAASVVAALWWCTVVVGWIAVFAVTYVWPQVS